MQILQLWQLYAFTHSDDDMWTTFAFVDTAVETPERPPKRSRAELESPESPIIPVSQKYDDTFSPTKDPDVFKRDQDGEYGLFVRKPDGRVLVYGGLDGINKGENIDKVKQEALVKLREGQLPKLGEVKINRQRLQYLASFEEQGRALAAAEQSQRQEEFKLREKARRAEIAQRMQEAEAERIRRAEAERQNEEAPQGMADNGFPVWDDEEWDDEDFEMFREDWADENKQPGD